MRDDNYVLLSIKSPMMHHACIADQTVMKMAMMCLLNSYHHVAEKSPWQTQHTHVYEEKV